MCFLPMEFSSPWVFWEVFFFSQLGYSVWDLFVRRDRDFGGAAFTRGSSNPGHVRLRRNVLPETPRVARSMMGYHFRMGRLLCLGTILLILLGAHLRAQPVASPYGPQQMSIDSDHDGLSDELEQTLLTQFKPVFMVSHADCSGVPAEFAPANRNPVVQSEDAVIYGQVFPGKAEGVATEPTVEIHYYHLWEKDCGRMGHAL